LLNCGCKRGLQALAEPDGNRAAHAVCYSSGQATRTAYEEHPQIRVSARTHGLVYQLGRGTAMKDAKRDDERASNDDGYRYDEDAEGHENQLKFDHDYATYDVLERKGLINPELEEKIREDLEQDMPGKPSETGDENKKGDSST